jgi:hypothetical protein
VLGLLLEKSAPNERNNIALPPSCTTDISIAEKGTEQPKTGYHHHLRGKAEITH